MRVLVAGIATASIHRSELREQPRIEPTASRRRRVARRSGVAGAGLVAGGLAALAVLAVVPIPEGPSRILSPSRLPVRIPLATPGALVNPTLGGGGNGDGSTVTDPKTIGGTAFREPGPLRPWSSVPGGTLLALAASDAGR